MVNTTVKKYQDLIYKRGYLITDEEIEPPTPDWIKVEIGRYTVFYDPLNDVRFEELGEKWVFLLGTAIDVLNETSDKKFITKHILNEWEKSDDHLFDYLDELAGRHILLFNDGEKTKILSDATGMKSIVYAKDANIIASHVELAQQLSGADRSPLIPDHWYKEYTGYHIPGHYTPYENIYFLTPNTLLEIESKRIVRFFPRNPVTMKKVDVVAEEISSLVKRQLKVLKKENKHMLFSLTAGMDSRTTLALLKEAIDQIEFFTYYKVSKRLPQGVKSLEIDREIVGEIAENLNLNHRFIPLLEDEVSNDYSEFVQTMKYNTFRPHSYRLAKFYYEKLPRETLHIRSNILEIGRYFYRGKMDLPDKVTLQALAQCFHVKAKEDPDVHSLLATYYDVVDMDQIFNYDPYDFFYWEYRMGTWHSQILLESDIAHDTFIPFNCRRILELMLSVPSANKKDFTVFKRIITKNWPILNYWGINTTEKPMDALQKKMDPQIDDYGKPLNVKFSGNTDYRSKNLGRKAKFYIDQSDPKKGDFAEAVIPLQTKPSTFYHAILQVRSPYENRKNKGRLKYQVILEDKIVLEEDIALWRESNQIHLHFQPTVEKATIRIRVLAIKDCEKWNWGRAGTMIIERFVLRESDKNTDSVHTTSPFSTIIGQ